MVIQKALHPLIGIAVFMAGMILGTTVHIYFGTFAIIGGLMLGFSTLRKDLPYMNKKSKLLFYGTFAVFTILFSSAFFFVYVFMR